MPRGPRLDYRGALQHVCMRGIERRVIFQDDDDRERFLKFLEKALGEAGNPCLAWALMPNHVHLLVESRGDALSRVMRRLGTRYAQAFNRKYDRVGHLFQNRYFSSLVDRDDYAVTAACYIMRNPLRAGIVPDLEALESYPWTSYAALFGGRRRPFQDVQSLLDYMGGEPWQSLLRIKSRMAEVETPTEAMVVRLPSDFQLNPTPCSSNSPTSLPLRELQPRELRRDGWNLDRLVGEVARNLMVDESELRSGRRLAPVSEARSLVGYLGHERLGLTYAAIGRATGVGGVAILKSLRRGQQVARDRGVHLLPDGRLTCSESRQS